ncbi:hypothetical protein HPB48_022218 [Haemaphysalis longicornis]|uniref:Transposase Tc1-like domain-containing protein n=1 Tax=Haemaphysalis longicornis TaxID=44386 RepID=A0A9J6GV47_HAELO|nr:hypothetical protein HPB48_022218 [Haemaphysalis longicornis]
MQPHRYAYGKRAATMTSTNVHMLREKKDSFRKLLKMAPRVTLQQREAIVHMGRTMSQRAISAATGRPLPTVNRILRAFQEDSHPQDAVRGEQQRPTTHEEDLFIVAAAVDAPFLSGKEIRDLLKLKVSAQTIPRRLHDVDMKSGIAAQKTLLERSHREQRMELASVVEDWTAENWRCVIFSDEASFGTCLDPQARVWRPD